MGSAVLAYVLVLSVARLGGNALKASSGINGTPTATQKSAGVEDSVAQLCVSRACTVMIPT